MVSDDEWDKALRDVQEAGVTVNPSDLPEWRSETGHWFTLDPPDERHGKDDWGVVVKHPGDPSGHWIRIGLGQGHAGIGQRVIQGLSRPDVVREMRKQLQRAAQAGESLRGQGGPGRFGEEHAEFHARGSDASP
jgi:hypothetical protein